MRTREEVNKAFGEGLRKFMFRKSLRLGKLAKDLGMSDVGFRSVRDGEVAPTLDKVMNLMDMGMTAEEAFGTEFCAKHFKPVEEEPAKKLDREKYDIIEAGLLAMLEKLREKRDA